MNIPVYIIFEYQPKDSCEWKKMECCTDMKQEDLDLINTDYREFIKAVITACKLDINDVKTMDSVAIYKRDENLNKYLEMSDKLDKADENP